MASYAPVPVFDPPTDPYAPARDSPRLNAHQYPPSAHNNDSLAYLDEPTTAPNPRFLQEGYNRDSLASRASTYTVGSTGEDRGLVAGAVAPAGYGAGGLGASGSYSDHTQQYDSGYNPAAYVYEPPKKRRGWLLPLIVALVLLVVLGVGLGVYFGVVKPNQQSASVKGGPNNGTSTSGGPRPTGTPTANVLLTGGDGSQVTMEDGNSKFTYNNSFGGYWYYDHKNPLTGPAGVANSWTPPSNESWPWGQNKQHGVNLGGWLVLEPFISPAMFEPYAPDAIDEYILSQRMAADTARGGLQTILEAHYKTFITEQDFANIAAAGLTWIRLPIGFWAIQKFDDEPFLEGVAWKYFVKAVVWARKYGLRINIDLHAVPGSQNGWNHSGKVGDVNWMMGAMGVANAQRALDIIRIITEFICQPEVATVVPMFGIMNEPRGNVVGPASLYDFNYQAYNVIRTISGPGKGPVISFHTGFLGNEGWNTFIPRADRIALDRHPYLIFGDRQSNDPPIQFAASVCTEWSTWTNTTSQEFGLNSAGEWSAAINDCGLWVNALGVGADYDQQFGAGSCDTWNNWETWTQDRKDEMRTFVAANMDALKDWFFWTWKIGPSTQFANKVVTPMWSYSLGWENGWIPKDPRSAAGTCQTLGYAQNTPFDGNFQTWQVTGQGGAVPAASDQYPWPPTQLIDVADASLAPTYVPTGPTPTIIAADFDIPQQLQTFVPKQLEGGMHVPIPGCTYPGTYQGVGAALPPPCTAAPGAGGATTSPVVPPAAGGATTSAPPAAGVTTTDPAPDAVPTDVAPA